MWLCLYSRYKKGSALSTLPCACSPAYFLQLYVAQMVLSHKKIRVEISCDNHSPLFKALFQNRYCRQGYPHLVMISGSRSWLLPLDSNKDKMEVSIENLLIPGAVDLRRSARIRNTPSTRSNSLDHSRTDTPALKSTSPKPSNPDPVLDSTPSKRDGLRRTKELSTAWSDPMIAAMKPLTDEERQIWKGWVELESNPVSVSHLEKTYALLGMKGLILISRNSSATFYVNTALRM